MNLDFVKIGNGPDFVMTHGRTEIMHKISVNVSDSGGASGRVQVLTMSNRSFQQCQMDLLQFLNQRADESGWRIGYMDNVTGSCLIQVGRFQCKITPLLPDKIWPTHRRTLTEIFTDKLRFLQSNQKHLTRPPKPHPC